MKKVIVSASAVAVLVAGLTLAGTARGQGAKEGAAELPHKVGLIDMAHVFKEYKKFEALRDELKAEISKSDEQAKGMVEALTAIQKQMKDVKEGTPDYQALEKQIVNKSAQFEAFKKTQQRDFLRKESQIYKTVYMEVSEFVQRYSEHYHYTLIIRFNREDPEASENPQEVMQRMNRQVVYFRPSDDITDDVVTYLNKQYGGKSAAPAERSATKQPRPTTTKQ